jgi:cobalt-precorrin 5A hydrolase
MECHKMKIAGIGFRAGATPASVLDALERAGAGGVTRLALPVGKALDPLAAELASRGFELVWIEHSALAATPTPTQSSISLQVYGTGSVAEAAALAAGGTRLLSHRVVSADGYATAALAEGGE